ncbi:hypothetical protein GGF32_005577 [Allomyces javanicus]|nr:hypothetical protein GGF32_005577 [Allomyces javanicus]
MSNFGGNHAGSDTAVPPPLTSHDGGEPVPIPSTTTSSPVAVPVEMATPHAGGYIGEHGLSQPVAPPVTSHDEGTPVQVPGDTTPNLADGPTAQTVPSAATAEEPTAAGSSTDAPLASTSPPVETAEPNSQIPEQGVPATSTDSTTPLPSTLPEPTSTTTPAAPAPSTAADGTTATAPAAQNPDPFNDPAAFFANGGFDDGSWLASPSGTDGNDFGSLFGGNNSSLPNTSNGGDTSNGDQLATPWGSDQGLQGMFGQSAPWAQPTQSGDGSGTGTGTGTVQLADMFASAPWGQPQSGDGTSGGNFASMLPDGFSSFF